MKRSIVVYGSESGLRVWREAVNAMPGYEALIEEYATPSRWPFGISPSSLRSLRRTSRKAHAILAISTLVGAAAAVVNPRTPVVAVDVGAGRAIELFGAKGAWIAATVVRPIASILALSAAHASALRAISRGRDRVHVVHQPASTPPFLWRPTAAAPYLLCAGSSGRDLHLLCEAAREIPVEVRLIVGGDELVPARGTSLPRSSPPNVIRYGQTSRDTYFRLLRGASALVHPLPPSNYPVGLTVLLDAMAMGVPVLATDVPSVSEYQDTGTAALVPAGDVPAMANAMLRAITDDAWARSLSRSGRRHAESILSARTIGAELSSIFGEVR